MIRTAIDILQWKRFIYMFLDVLKAFAAAVKLIKSLEDAKNEIKGDFPNNVRRTKRIPKDSRRSKLELRSGAANIEVF